MTREEAIKHLNSTGWLDERNRIAIHFLDSIGCFEEHDRVMTGSAGRPKGEWADMNGNPVPLNEDGETTNSCWCSECGEWLVASDEYPTRGNFCPNCGADMRPTERSEE